MLSNTKFFWIQYFVNQPLIGQILSQFFTFLSTIFKKMTQLLTVISTKTPQEADVGIFANWTAPPHAHLWNSDSEYLSVPEDCSIFSSVCDSVISDRLIHWVKQIPQNRNSSLKNCWKNSWKKTETVWNWYFFLLTIPVWIRLGNCETGWKTR